MSAFFILSLSLRDRGAFRGQNIKFTIIVDNVFIYLFLFTYKTNMWNKNRQTQNMPLTGDNCVKFANMAAWQKAECMGVVMNRTHTCDSNRQTVGRWTQNSVDFLQMYHGLSTAGSVLERLPFSAGDTQRVSRNIRRLLLRRATTKALRCKPMEREEWKLMEWQFCNHATDTDL